MSPWLAALAAGILCGLGFLLGDPVVRYGGTLWASVIAQAVGALAAGLAFGALRAKRARAAADGQAKDRSHEHAPRWSYLAGLPAAITVVLASVTTNSEIGLSGTLSLMLLGQVTFGLAADQRGLFRMAKRQPTMLDFFGVLTIMTGSAVIIFFAS